MIEPPGHYIRLISRLVKTFVRDPFVAAVHFKNIPTHLEAFHFARTARFSPREGQSGSATPDSNTPDNPLRHYFDAHTEGPGIWKWDHYFEIYHRHLAKFVGRPAHLVEVGIYSGGSLQMWRSYFGAGMQIHGIDIEPVCEVYRTDGIDICIGDQADRAFWADFRRKNPAIDILIDDGGHTPEQQRVTLEEMLPHLRPGGIYICEDIHGEHNHFASYISGLCNAMNATTTDEQPGLALNEMQKCCHSIHIYPCLVVIEKHSVEQARLMNSRRGTQWQPFFPEAGA